MTAMADTNKKLFCIIGNIGVGKSELVKRFRDLNNTTTTPDAPSCVVIPEPVKLWQKIGLLPALYRDFRSGEAARTGTPYKFQQLAFSSRLMEYLDVDWDSSRIAIADGHVYVDRHVFAHQLHESGMMSSEEMMWYDESFRHWEKLVPLAMPQCFIYLRAEPSVCIERIRVRGREEEKDISLEYLTALHNRFESLSLPSTVHIIDASQSSEKVFEEIVSIIGKCKALGQHELCARDICIHCTAYSYAMPAYHHCLRCGIVCKTNTS